MQLGFTNRGIGPINRVIVYKTLRAACSDGRARVRCPPISLVAKRLYTPENPVAQQLRRPWKSGAGNR